MGDQIKLNGREGDMRETIIFGVRGSYIISFLSLPLPFLSLILFQLPEHCIL